MRPIPPFNSKSYNPFENSAGRKCSCIHRVGIPTAVILGIKWFGLLFGSVTSLNHILILSLPLLCFSKVTTSALRLIVKVFL